MATQTEDKDTKAEKAQAAKEGQAKAQATAKKAADAAEDKAPAEEAPAVEPAVPGGPQTADPSTRSVSTEAIEEEKPLSEAVAQDAEVFDKGKDGGGPAAANPSHFVETYGEHDETGKEQALRHAGDGTLSVWPAQPATAKPVTLGPEGTPLED